MDYNAFFRQLFKTDKGIQEKLLGLPDPEYLGAVFGDKELTYEKVISFIDKYKSNIITCALKDISFIDNLITEDNKVDTSKRVLVNEKLLEGLLEKIKNKEFDNKALVFYIYIVGIHNLCNSYYTEEETRSILDTSMISIVNNTSLVGKDGDIIPIGEERVTITDKLLSWNEKCGDRILPYIFFLEELKKNTEILLSSPKINRTYKEQLEFIRKICEYSILVRDTSLIPTKEEVRQINNVFDNYDSINKSIILDTIDKGDIMLVHFVRDNDVDYHLVGESIMDLSEQTSNHYDNDQANFFVNSYYQYAISEIEKQLNRKFDINDQECRDLLSKYLDDYNDSINNRPLDRLPIKKREISNGFREYIRETDGRTSCSFVSKDNPVSHLDRKIGLIIRPLVKKAILSTSLGYTSEKDYYDFRKDSSPCTETFNTLSGRKCVNETCVDIEQCEVVGVLLLSDEKEMVERAERIAASYNTQVIRLVKEKGEKYV